MKQTNKTQNVLHHCFTTLHTYLFIINISFHSECPAPFVHRSAFICSSSRFLSLRMFCIVWTHISSSSRFFSHSEYSASLSHHFAHVFSSSKFLFTQNVPYPLFIALHSYVHQQDFFSSQNVAHNCLSHHFAHIPSSSFLSLQRPLDYKVGHKTQ